MRSEAARDAIQTAGITGAELDIEANGFITSDLLRVFVEYNSYFGYLLFYQIV